MGLPDPRTQGSNNPGATNLLRLTGKKAAALTLLGDMLKGLLPCLLAKNLQADMTTVGLVGLAAFLGHLYPIFFKFSGGKGVATIVGVLLGFNWYVGLSTIATWLCFTIIFLISALSALIATFCAPFYVWYFLQNSELVMITTVMVVLVYWRHRSNIKNILAGTEDRLTDEDEVKL